MSKASTITWWVFKFALILLPVLTACALKIPFDKTVNPVYVNGFITASSIFLGFLTATLVNKREILEHSLKLAIYCDFFFFGGALIIIFGQALQTDPKAYELIIITMSLMSDIGTATTILKRLRS